MYVHGVALLHGTNVACAVMLCAMPVVLVHGRACPTFLRRLHVLQQHATHDGTLDMVFRPHA
jgi:hypothetical protein